MNEPPNSRSDVEQLWGGVKPEPADESEEVEYAACILMAGAPDFIAKKNWGGGTGAPVSTTAYRQICYVWWCDNVGHRPRSERAYNYEQKEFILWWARYKTWLVGVHNGLH